MEQNKEFEFTQLEKGVILSALNEVWNNDNEKLNSKSLGFLERKITEERRDLLFTLIKKFEQ